MKDPVWNVKVYGGRGSTPVCEPGFQKYGGNTTCIYVDLLINDRSKMIVVFDAGTGIRILSDDIEKGKIPKTEDIYLIFTHLHWDHVQGFPFFSPAYNPNQKIGIFYPKENLAASELKHLFEIQMQAEFFPVQLNNMGAEFSFLVQEEAQSQLNGNNKVKFSYREHNHPGGAFSYRLEANGKTIVLCTDLEHGKEIDQDVVGFCRDADLLIHDAQYTEEHYAGRQLGFPSTRGWGHSTPSMACDVARAAKVKELALFHYDPGYDDKMIADIERKARNRFANTIAPYEGMTMSFAPVHEETRNQYHHADTAILWSAS